MGKSRVENKVYLFKYLLHLQKLYYSLKSNGIDYDSTIGDNLKKEIKELKIYLGMYKDSDNEYTFKNFDLTVTEKPKV